MRTDEAQQKFAAKPNLEVYFLESKLKHVKMKDRGKVS